MGTPGTPLRLSLSGGIRLLGLLCGKGFFDKKGKVKKESARKLLGAVGTLWIWAGLLFCGARAEARDIYVRLASGGSFVVEGERGMTLLSGGKKEHNLGRSASIALKGGKAVIGKQAFSLPVRLFSTGLLRYNKRSYRGDFLLTKNGLLNVLKLEDYLRGVLPAEVGSKWPAEALRVQAIISRTYALRQSLRRAARGYDVTDTVSDQVYRGAGVETSRTNQAVQSTEGEIVVYGKELAFTPFHSDSGGHTANNADVWGKVLPYLGGVREPKDYRSPNASWTVRIPRSGVETALAKIGSGVGAVSAIRIAGTDKGGRATLLTFVGSAGSKTVKSSLFRMAVGPNLLKSTMLDAGSGVVSAPEPARRPPLSLPPVNGVGTLPEVKESDWFPEASNAADGGLPRVPVPTSNEPLSPKQEMRLTQMTEDGVFSTAELIDMLTNPNKKKGYLYLGLQRGESGGGGGKRTPQPTTPPRKPKPSDPSAPSPRGGGAAIAREGDVFVFKGRGWGHGVGLSQWGALALAGDGWTAERILEHYYPGTLVKRVQ